MKNSNTNTNNTPHLAKSSGNNEWYTPSHYIELARQVLGSIDVDPASNETAQSWIKASTYYTAETNGLEQDWKGKVWINPPYSRELIGPFIDKLLNELDNGNTTEAIVLVNDATDTRWFRKLITHKTASAICFPKRIRFIMADGTKKGGPTRGQAFIYLGPNPEKFNEAFRSEGPVLVPFN